MQRILLAFLVFPIVDLIRVPFVFAAVVTVKRIFTEG